MIDIKVTVTVDLGEKTVALLHGLQGGVAIKTPRIPEPETDEPQAPEPVAPPTTARTRTTAAKAKQPETPGFEDLDEDAKLEAIKAEVTKHTKKGKSADIKALLTGFEANRASELDPENYDAFMKAVKRYGAGESIDDIIGLD